jgi:hypothetical protein
MTIKQGHLLELPTSQFASIVELMLNIGRANSSKVYRLQFDQAEAALKALAELAQKNNEKLINE